MKLSIVLFISILTITLFFQGCITEDQTNNNALFVSLSDDAAYSSIQSAINDSTNNGIIYVSEGIYYENINIAKPITLIGSGKNTIIDGSYKENVIEITSNNVTILNITIQHANNTTNNDEIRNGINILSNSNSISNCRIVDNKIGIHLNKNQLNFITNNSFENCNYGIWAESSVNNTIKNNFFTNNSAYGMYIYTYCNQNLIEKNRFTKNLIALRVKGDFNTIKYNEFFENQGGIYLCCSAIENIVYHNNFIENDEYNARGNYRNIWQNDSQMQGNYWSDYNGSDVNNDNVGDSSYVISSRNRSGVEEYIIDKYPLMQALNL